MQLAAPEIAGHCTCRGSLQSNYAETGPLKPGLQQQAGSMPWPAGSKPTDDICVKAQPVVERSKRFLKWGQHVIMQKHAETWASDATVHLPRTGGRSSCSFYTTRQLPLWTTPRGISLPPQKRLSPKSWRGKAARKAIARQGFELHAEWLSGSRKWMKCTGRMGNSQEEENRGVREDPLT